MSPFHRNDDDEGDGVCNINEPDKSKAATVDVIEDQALELDTSPDLNQMFREAIEKMWPCRDYEENLQNVINGKFELAPLSLTVIVYVLPVYLLLLQLPIYLDQTL